MAAPPTDAFRNFQTNITEVKAQSTPSTSGNALSRGPSPNRGALVPDNKAIGPESKPQSDWLSEHGIDKSRWVRLKKLSHMRYQHENLDQITSFLRGKQRRGCRINPAVVLTKSQILVSK